MELAASPATEIYKRMNPQQRNIYKKICIGHSQEETVSQSDVTTLGYYLFSAVIALSIPQTRTARDCESRVLVPPWPMRIMPCQVQYRFIWQMTYSRVAKSRSRGKLADSCRKFILLVFTKYPTLHIRKGVVIPNRRTCRQG